MTKIKTAITQEEFEKLLKYTLNSKKKRKRELALALLLGFEAGMRISEIVGLKYPRAEEYHIPPLQADNIDFAKNYILVKQGKGKKDRIVPLPKRVNRRAIELLPLTISRRSLQWHVTLASKKLFQKDMTFHTLRAGFITHALDKGVPIHQVQLLAGHSRMDTTGIYARASPKQAVDNVREIF